MTQKRRAPEKEAKSRRETILDLSPYMGREIQAKLTGGKEVKGILTGYDQVCNLVMDQAVEYYETGIATVRQNPDRRREEAGNHLRSWADRGHGGTHAGL